MQQTAAQALWQAEIGEDEMERTFVSLFEREGWERGLKQGLARGRQEVLLKQLRRKLDRVPPEAEARLQQLTDPAELDGLAERLIDGVSPADLGLVTAEAA